jgi:hypothetical protein
LHPEQRRILKAMTPEQKLHIFLRLYYSARRLKTAALRQQHPNWSPAEIEQTVTEIFLNART